MQQLCNTTILELKLSIVGVNSHQRPSGFAKHGHDLVSTRPRLPRVYDLNPITTLIASQTRMTKSIPSLVDGHPRMEVERARRKDNFLRLLAWNKYLSINMDIFIAVESKTGASVHDAEFLSANYFISLKDRTCHGGGSLYCHKGGYHGRDPSKFRHIV